MPRVGNLIGRHVAPAVPRLAPDLNSSFIHRTLERAIHGVGPLPGAAAGAETQLREQKGDVERAIHEVIENHVRWSAAQGFATNLGGLIAVPVTIPANITGLAVLQSRMVAGIAHLRGYDLADPRVHNAVLLCLLGENTVKALVKSKKLPATPFAVATAPAHDPDLDRTVAAEVTSAMVNRVIGKKAATTIARRVPLVGGVVGASGDGYATWQVGRYADRELHARAR